MSAYPEWVDAYRALGKTIKKVGNSYYLYKTKSVRIPGKTNPQPQSEYLGRITKEGLVCSNVKKLNTNTVRVYEYGFSFALKELMPEDVLENVKDKKRAEGIFLHLVHKYSQTSYLLRNVALPDKEELHMHLPTYEKKFERLTGLAIEALLPLRHIYLVETSGQGMLSEITPEQKALLKELRVRI